VTIPTGPSSSTNSTCCCADEAVTRAAAGALTLLLGTVAVGAPLDDSSVPSTCQAWVEAGGFRTRFEVIGPLTRATACTMKGVFDEEEFHVIVGRRVERWLGLCFTEKEQVYLRGVLRQGTMQSMGFVSAESCRDSLAQLTALPELR